MPKRKNIKDCLIKLLNSSYFEEDLKLTGSMQIAKGLFESAKSGNVPAIKALLEITEQQNEGASLTKLYEALSRSDD